MPNFTLIGATCRTCGVKNLKIGLMSNLNNRHFALCAMLPVNENSSLLRNSQYQHQVQYVSLSLTLPHSTDQWWTNIIVHVNWNHSTVTSTTYKPFNRYLTLATTHTMIHGPHRNTNMKPWLWTTMHLKCWQMSCQTCRQTDWHQVVTPAYIAENNSYNKYTSIQTTPQLDQHQFGHIHDIHKWKTH